jgi:hypothetical protein
MNINTTHTAALQADQFDNLTWDMYVLAGTKKADADHAEWILNIPGAMGSREAIRLASSAATMGGKLATA